MLILNKKYIWVRYFYSVLTIIDVIIFVFLVSPDILLNPAYPKPIIYNIIDSTLFSCGRFLIIFLFEIFLFNHIGLELLEVISFKRFFKKSYLKLSLIILLNVFFPSICIFANTIGILVFILKECRSSKEEIKPVLKAGAISGLIYGMLNAIITGILQWTVINIYDYEVPVSWSSVTIPIVMLLAFIGGMVGGILFGSLLGPKYGKIPERPSKGKVLIVSLLFWLVLHVGLSGWNMRFGDEIFYLITIAIGLVLTLFWGYLLIFFLEKFTSKADPNLVDNKTLRRDGDLQEE